MRGLQRHYCLKHHNTFVVDAVCDYYCAIFSSNELCQLIKRACDYDLPLWVLGQGSNTLFTKHVAAIILHNCIKGVEVVQEDDNVVCIRVGGGELWSTLVDYTVAQGWGGLENLSLIPGTVGAAPVQNIGAYGVELEQCFVRAEAVDLKSAAKQDFNNEECLFAYRQSIFKTKLKGCFFITHVILKLQKKHQLCLAYPGVRDFLIQQNIHRPNIHDVSRAIKSIRQTKLPDPAHLPNAGSFFKNPIVSQDRFLRLKQQYPSMPFYPYGKAQIKIPAGWLIEAAGLKGMRVGNVGIHNKQALILVNYKETDGQKIIELCDLIIDRIKKKFTIILEPEVNIL